MQNLDQKRAKHAWDCIVQIKNRNKDEQKKYGSQAKKLPMRIMNAGLGQAIAFLEAKKYSPQLCKDLGAWVLNQGTNIVNERALQEKIIGCDSEKLRYFTAEALAYLQWLTRFAEAEGLVDLTTGEN